MRKTPFILSCLLLQLAFTLTAQPLRLVVPVGHTAAVNSITFSPDGSLLLSASHDGTAKLWDRQGRELLTLQGHRGAVWAAAFSPDGQTILTGGQDSTAILWDLQGKRKTVFKGHSGEVRAVAFSPDSITILTGSHDKTARIWRLDGTPMKTFKPHPGFVTSVAFTPDGKSILTTCFDAAVLWSADGSRQRRFKKDNSPITCAAISPDGQHVLTGSDNNKAKLWPIAGGEPVAIFQGHHAQGITSVAFSLDGQQVLTSSKDGTAITWDLKGKKLNILSGHTRAVQDVAFSPDGKTLVTSSSDFYARLWDGQGRPATILKGHAKPITAVAFSPNGEQVLMGSRDSTAKRWDLMDRSVQPFRGHTDVVTSVAFSPDGLWVLTGSEDKTAKLWDSRGRDTATFRGHAFPVGSVSFSPDGQTVLTGSVDKTAKRWHLDGKEIKAVTIRDSTGIAFSPDGKTISTGGGANAKRWDLSTLDLKAPNGQTIIITALAFSPDGRKVLTGSEDGSAKLWDVQGGPAVQTFSKHNGAVTSVAFSPDGKIVLTGSEDNTAIFWSAESGKKIATLIPIGINDWVATTPEGLFDASPRAMKLMHYVVGIEAIDIEQLKGRYYEPWLLPKALGLVRGGLRPVEGMGSIALYPSITAARIDGDTLRAKLQVRSGGMGRLALLIDGNIELEADTNPERASEIALDLSRFAPHFLPGTVNQLSLRTYNQEGWLKSFPYELTYLTEGVREKGSNNTDPNNNPRGSNQRLFTDNEQQATSFAARNDEALCEITLYALIVGTSKYSGNVAALTYPDQDARAFSEALRATGEGLFCGTEKVDITLLTTSEGAMPRKAEIASAVKGIASKAQPNDILLIFLSGHGIAHPANSEQSRFHYLTTDVTSDKLEDEAVRNHLAISQDTLMAWIRGVPARKRILILDACNSGQVVQTLGTGEKSLNSDQRRALEMLNDRSGMFVLAGSAADKSSYEATSYGHGLLTYSLLKNMPEVAAKNEKRVEVYELFKRAFDEVPLLAQRVGKEQKPEMIGSASFPIGRIDGNAPYPMPKALPVFLRCNFTQKGKRSRDRQPLSIAADARLAELASEKKPRLAFWDLTEFEGDHFAIDGEYSVEGNALSGSAQVYRKDEALGEIPFSGTLDGLEEIAEYIIAKAIALLPKDKQ